jgi:hypothetical protein
MPIRGTFSDHLQDIFRERHINSGVWHLASELLLTLALVIVPQQGRRGDRLVLRKSAAKELLGVTTSMHCRSTDPY